MSQAFYDAGELINGNNRTDKYAMEKNSHLITTIHHIKSEHLASSAALCFRSARYNYLQLIWLSYPKKS